MLVTGHNVLRLARENGYAIGAFDISDLEMLHSVVSACVSEKSPVIIQTTESAIRYAGAAYLAGMTKIAAREQIPVVLHLDHGKNLSTVKTCVANGYTSVMFDGSRLPFNENVAITKQIVLLSKGKISVEAELGVILGREDDISSAKAYYTDPEMAKLFVKKTDVDSLAVAIGTRHGLSAAEIGSGMKKKKIRLRLDVLKEISDSIDIPLVLHGGSDVKPQAIRKCIRLGVSKINIDTELRVAFTLSLKEFMRKNPEVYDPREMLRATMDAMQKVVKTKVREFGCAGRA